MQVLKVQKIMRVVIFCTIRFDGFGPCFCYEVIFLVFTGNLLFREREYGTRPKETTHIGGRQRPQDQ